MCVSRPIAPEVAVQCSSTESGADVHVVHMAPKFVLEDPAIPLSNNVRLLHHMYLDDAKL